MPRKPKTPVPSVKLDDDFMKALEDGVRRVLSNPKATPGQLLQAVATGAKLEQIRHKIESGDNGGRAPDFFSE